jgi:hypothetical protein
MASDAADEDIKVEQAVPSAHPSRLRASTEYLRGLEGCALGTEKREGTCIQEMSPQKQNHLTLSHSSAGTMASNIV